MPFALKTITLGCATVGRIQCAEETDNRNRCVGELIARDPASSGVTMRCNAQSVVARALAVSHEAFELVEVVRMNPWAVVVIRLPAIQQIAFFFQAEDGIRDTSVTGVQTCALPIYSARVSTIQNEQARKAPSPGGRPSRLLVSP